jgi:hypothetical protein
MVRIYFISVILCSLFIPSCSEKKDKLDCSTVKKGKFEYKGGFWNKHFSIERDDSIQIERDEDTGFGMRFKIEWKEGCEYELTPLSFIINGKDSAIENLDSRRMNTQILKVTGNYYICRSVITGEKAAHLDTMLIIR